MIWITPGRHITRSGKEVYIAGRCKYNLYGTRTDYVWRVEDNNGGYSVDQYGRAMKNTTTIFDIVSRVDQGEKN